MKRAERVCAGRDFVAVRTKGRAVHSGTLTVSWLATDRPLSRFGFVTSKKVGGAVQRNLVKRRLRAIIDARRGHVAPGFDIVLIAKLAAAQSDFPTLAAEVDRLLRRGHLLRDHPSPTAIATSQQQEMAAGAPVENIDR